MLCCLYGCHYGLLLLLFACLHIVISHSTICAIFVDLVLFYVFGGATYLNYVVLKVCSLLLQ